MARPRHSINPQKVKFEVDALDDAPPAEALARRLALRRRLSVALLCALTIVLLSVSFAPFDISLFAYIALVPWMLALSDGARRRWTLLWAWLAGLVFWAANLYWLWWITLLGYAALVLYLSAYWFVAAVVVRSAWRRNLPMWLAFPIVWTALEFARAHVISGFPWLFLAHSQYAQTRLIQVCDLTGQYGVTFFVAMVNGLIVDVLASPLIFRPEAGPRLTRRVLVALAVVLATLVALLGYGTFRLSQDTQQEGPVLAFVQCSFRNTLHGRDKPAEEILSTVLKLARPLEGKGCDLVIGPETTLPPGLNREVLKLDLADLDGELLRGLAFRFAGPKVWQVESDEVLRAFLDEQLFALLPTGALSDPWTVPYDASRLAMAGLVRDASRRLGCPVLIGGETWHANRAPIIRGDEWLQKNSAVMYDGKGPREGIYAKMHPVPFSEYVPFKRSWPWLHRTLRGFVPPVMSQLEPGGDASPLELAAGEGEPPWYLATPICYEGAFARVCRRLVRATPREHKGRLILANLSNDGWFVWRSGDGALHESTEHYQHLAAYCFRAVENRVPVVRAVNTGVSASIDSNGRIVAAIEQRGTRTLVNGAMLLDGAPGGGPALAHGPRVLVDERITVYSSSGDVFAAAASLAAVAMVVVLAWKRLRTGKDKPRGS